MTITITTDRLPPLDFELPTSVGVARTIANVRSLLATRMGEVPYDRFRGIDPQVLALPVTELNGGALTEELDRVLMWEEDAALVSCRAYKGADGETVLSVTCDIAEEDV